MLVICQALVWFDVTEQRWPLEIPLGPFGRRRRLDSITRIYTTVRRRLIAGLHGVVCTCCCPRRVHPHL